MYELRGAERKEKSFCPLNYTRNFRIGHFVQDFLEFISFSGGHMPVNHFLVLSLENFMLFF